MRKRISSYMKSEMDFNLLNLQDAEQVEVWFRHEFHQLVLELRFDVQDRLRKAPKIFQLFVYNEELNKLDDRTTEWFDYAVICNQILIDIEHFTKQVYEEFKMLQNSLPVRKQRNKERAWRPSCLN